MNLVSGYGSSDSEDDAGEQPHQGHQLQQQQQQQQQQRQQSKGKAKANTGTRPGDHTNAPTSKKRKKRKKGKTKVVNALILSPEIQAALARGDTLGDSDSDEASAKKPPKIVRPKGANPNDLLSLLPQPSTAASADDILLKSQQKRREKAAKAAKQAATTEASQQQQQQQQQDESTRDSTKAKSSSHYCADAGSTPSVPTPIATTATTSTTAVQVAAGFEQGEESESDAEGDHDLLANMRAKSGAAASTTTSANETAPLFTLPSREKLPSPSFTPGVAQGTEARGNGTVDSDVGAVGGGLAPSSGASGTRQQHMGVGAREGVLGGWGGGSVRGGCGAMQQSHGGASMYAVNSDGVSAGGGPSQAYGAPLQQEAPSPYDPAAALSASVGAAPEDGCGEAAGGKATRRRGRDMERALARGDLGALGNKTPVMDLHQGSNEFNPLRTKPITAAMKQDQKHIEGSVYDPHTGTTKKTLEPTSMQKRKHQINQLAVQAASMERDLMERSGASRLTKAQTHAKYGW